MHWRKTQIKMVMVYACDHEADLKIREENGVREETKQCSLEHAESRVSVRDI